MCISPNDKLFLDELETRASEVNQSGGKCLIQGMTHFRVTLTLITAPVTGGILSSKMYGVYFIRLSVVSKKTVKVRKHRDRWKCLIHSLLLSGCRRSDDGAAHSCTHHCLLHYAPAGLQCLVMCTMATRFGFPYRSFPLNVNHFRSLSCSSSLSFIIEAQNINQTTFDYCHSLQYDPCEKMAFSGQSAIQELID